MHTLTIIKPSNTVHISSIRGQASLPTQVFHNSFQASNKQGKAQLLNYFYFVFSTDNDTLVIVPPTYASTCIYLHDIEVTEMEVLTMLNHLDINKTAGIDNISPKVLRYCALPLLKQIFNLFTISLTTSSVPMQRRTHCVHKSGDKSLVNNYQPISLLCILSIKS